MELQEIIDDLAYALKEKDKIAPVEKKYKPGIGPHGEDRQIQLALDFLKTSPSKKDIYETVNKQKYPDDLKTCDIVIPNEYAIEVKLLRPLGDNGKENGTNWLSKILYPFESNTSAIGDVLKLKNSKFEIKKAIILLSYRPEDDEIVQDKILTTLQCFEKITKDVLNINIGMMVKSTFKNLIHPVHNLGEIFGWEIME